MKEEIALPKALIKLPNGAPPPRGAYSAALKAGDFIFVSGQSARDEKLSIVGVSVEEQTERTIRNIAVILESCGATWANVVKSTVHLSDLRSFHRYDAVYASLVPEPRPVRTTVGSVLAEGILVEIDVVAYLPGK